MPATEAQILANRANAQKSTGPKTEDGKAASRGNALKHGLTGEGVALVEADAAEVERKNAGFQADLRPTSEVGRMLVLRLATMAVRMERCVAQENAAIAENVRQALEEFEAPEGLDDREVDRLRSLAADLALFDPSKGACLARKYEAAAERAFYKALKEFREVEGRGRAPALVASAGPLASFSPAPIRPVAAPVPPPSRPLATPTPRNLGPISPARPVAMAPSPVIGGYDEVPFAIGRAR